MDKHTRKNRTQTNTVDNVRICILKRNTSSRRGCFINSSNLYMIFSIFPANKCFVSLGRWCENLGKCLPKGLKKLQRILLAKYLETTTRARNTVCVVQHWSYSYQKNTKNAYSNSKNKYERGRGLAIHSAISA